jgi:hypothetical protein
VHERRGARQRLLHHDAGRQGVFPFDIAAQDAGLIETVLHEVNIGVARPRKLPVQREGRPAREQHDGQPIAKEVLDRHARIGRAGIDMDQHGLAAAGRDRIAGRHVDRDHLVGTQDDLGVPPPLAVPARDLLDERHMVGAEIGEDVLDAEVDEGLEEVVRGAVGGHGEA